MGLLILAIFDNFRCFNMDSVVIDNRSDSAQRIYFSLIRNSCFKVVPPREILPRGFFQTS